MLRRAAVGVALLAACGAAGCGSSEHGSSQQRTVSQREFNQAMVVQERAERRAAVARAGERVLRSCEDPAGARVAVTSVMRAYRRQKDATTRALMRSLADEMLLRGCSHEASDRVANAAG